MTHPLQQEREKLEAFEEKWRDKGDERYGLVKHNNNVLQRQVDEIQDMLTAAFTRGREEVLGEVRDKIINMESEERAKPCNHQTKYGVICSMSGAKLEALSSLLASLKEK
jgi:hypothetical protein